MHRCEGPKSNVCLIAANGKPLKTSSDIMLLMEGNDTLAMKHLPKISGRECGPCTRHGCCNSNLSGSAWMPVFAFQNCNEKRSFNAGRMNRNMPADCHCPRPPSPPCWNISDCQRCQLPPPCAPEMNAFVPNTRTCGIECKMSNGFLQNAFERSPDQAQRELQKNVQRELQREVYQDYNQTQRRNNRSARYVDSCVSDSSVIWNSHGSCDPNDRRFYNAKANGKIYPRSPQMFTDNHLQARNPSAGPRIHQRQRQRNLCPPEMNTCAPPSMRPCTIEVSMSDCSQMAAFDRKQDRRQRNDVLMPDRRQVNDGRLPSRPQQIVYNNMNEHPEFSPFYMANGAGTKQFQCNSPCQCCRRTSNEVVELISQKCTPAECEVRKNAYELRNNIVKSACGCCTNGPPNVNELELKNVYSQTLSDNFYSACCEKPTFEKPLPNDCCPTKMKKKSFDHIHIVKVKNDQISQISTISSKKFQPKKKKSNQGMICCTYCDPFPRQKPAVTSNSPNRKSPGKTTPANVRGNKFSIPPLDWSHAQVWKSSCNNSQESKIDCMCNGCDKLSVGSGSSCDCLDCRTKKQTLLCMPQKECNRSPESSCDCPECTTKKQTLLYIQQKICNSSPESSCDCLKCSMKKQTLLCMPKKVLNRSCDSSCDCPDYRAKKQSLLCNKSEPPLNFYTYVQKLNKSMCPPKKPINCCPSLPKPPCLPKCNEPEEAKPCACVLPPKEEPPFESPFPQHQNPSCPLTTRLGRGECPCPCPSPINTPQDFYNSSCSSCWTQTAVINNCMPKSCSYSDCCKICTSLSSSNPSMPMRCGWSPSMSSKDIMPNKHLPIVVSPTSLPKQNLSSDFMQNWIKCLESRIVSLEDLLVKRAKSKANTLPAEMLIPYSSKLHSTKSKALLCDPCKRVPMLSRTESSSAKESCNSQVLSNVTRQSNRKPALSYIECGLGIMPAEPPKCNKNIAKLTRKNTTFNCCKCGEKNKSCEFLNSDSSDYESANSCETLTNERRSMFDHIEYEPSNPYRGTYLNNVSCDSRKYNEVERKVTDYERNNDSCNNLVREFELASKSTFGGLDNGGALNTAPREFQSLDTSRGTFVNKVESKEKNRNKRDYDVQNSSRVTLVNEAKSRETNKNFDSKADINDSKADNVRASHRQSKSPANIAQRNARSSTNLKQTEREGKSFDTGEKTLPRSTQPRNSQ